MRLNPQKKIRLAILILFGVTLLRPNLSSSNSEKPGKELVKCSDGFRSIALPSRKWNGENTQMRGQFSQFPVAPVIPREFTGTTQRITGASGDVFAKIGNDDFARIVLPNSRHERLLEAPKANVRPASSLSAAEKQILAENFVRKEWAGSGEATVKMVTSAALADPQTMKKVFDQYERGILSLSTSSREVATKTSRESALAAKAQAEFGNELDTATINRYFQFTPDGEQTPVAARILDLHLNNRGEARIYAEWMRPAGSTEDRTRHVGMITLDELKTIPKLLPQIRSDAEKVFFDSLTQNQLNVRLIADQLGIPPRGHSDFLRAPGTAEGSAKTITEKMGILAHHAIRSWTESKFGSIADLLSDAERQSHNWNAMDVMGRLDPQYLLKRFHSTNYKYMYVITEDGQLKISPLGELDSNLRPQLLRLGHGRKIFSVGTFTLDETGAANLTLRTGDYASFDSHIASSILPPEGEHRLARAVFRMQANTEVKSVNATTPDSWSEIRMNFDTGFFEHVNPTPESPNSSNFTSAFSRGKPSGRYNGWDGSATEKFVRDLMEAKPKPEPITDWDRMNSAAVPPSYKEWRKLALDDSPDFGLLEDRIAYAHYILGTADQSTMSEIRNAYRKLITRFFSKDGKDESTTTAASIINDAYAVFKDREKSRR